MTLDKIVKEKGEEWNELFEKMLKYVSNNKDLLAELHNGALVAVTINRTTEEPVIIDNGSAPHLKERIKDIGNRYPKYDVFIITDSKTYEEYVKK